MTILRLNRREARDKISAREGRFTPCKQGLSLLERMTDAAENAARQATILLSPARSSFDGFQNARNSGEKLYCTVESISWGRHSLIPNMNGETSVESNYKMSDSGKQKFSFRGFLRENHEANNPTNSTSLQKGRQERQRQ